MNAERVARMARAARLADYFELQLRFVAHMAPLLGLSLSQAVLRYTNFHRRFGLGDPDTAPSAAWAGYADELERQPTLPAQLAWTQAFFVAAPQEEPLPGRLLFGSFSHEPPDADGVVRIHFVNRDRDGASPLDSAKIGRRKAELTAMFGDIARRHPGARSVRGISWLYHLEAYRRLFPPDYGAAARPASRARLNGTSSWGQFLRHDENIRPALRDALLGNLPGLDLAAPWRSFPLPVLSAEAPIQAFHAFYATS